MQPIFLIVVIALTVGIVLIVKYTTENSKHNDKHKKLKRRIPRMGSKHNTLSNDDLRLQISRRMRKVNRNHNYRQPRQHPVLNYQRRTSYDTHPANYGDPIRPPVDIAGPVVYGSNYDRYTYDANGRAKVYGENMGPYPGKPLNIPVPQSSLKMSSEEYKYPFYNQSIPLKPYDFFKPYGNNRYSMQRDIVVSDTPFYKRRSLGGLRYNGLQPVPFISSVNSYSPFPEVNTPWEKAGMIQTEITSDDTVMNLYRRPIAPLQDLFEYAVQDKNGFIIPLKNINFLENNDTIPFVPGYESKGPWKVKIYVNNKWVWA